LISNFNEYSGTGSLPLGELNDLSPLTLVRTALALRPGLVLGFALFRSGLTSCFTVRVFLVFFLRQRGGDTAVTEIHDGDQEIILTAPDSQAVAGLQRAPGLDAMPVELNLAAFNGFAGERAGFEKPCGPQPFINPDWLAHQSIVALISW
jgi:hypothetical protein